MRTNLVNSTPNSIKAEDFLRMLNPEGLRLAKPFIDEENDQLMHVLKGLRDIEDASFISIGAGPLLHLDIALTYTKQYIAVDPLTPQLLTGLQYDYNRVQVIPKIFEEGIQSDIHAGGNIFFFAFNVLAYINEPLHHLNLLLNKEDYIIVSVWSPIETAAPVAKPYFEYVNQKPLADFVIPYPSQPCWEAFMNQRSSQIVRGKSNTLIVISNPVC